MYSYEKMKVKLFSDEGQRMFLLVRDFAKKALSYSGAVMASHLMRSAGGGDSWLMLACIDRLVELGEIRPVQQDDFITQNLVYVSGREE